MNVGECADVSLSATKARHISSGVFRWAVVDGLLGNGGAQTN